MVEIEDFSISEVDSVGDVDSPEEVRQLAEELGLKGQQKLLSQNSTTVFPYRRMTAQEQSVYGILCPQRTKIEDYGDMVIPLRVLQIASHAEKLGFFKKLLVWHPSNGDKSDPVLVGIYENKENWNRDEPYILARWGEVLEPFSSLTEKAKKAGVALLRSRLSEIARKVESRLATVDEVISLYVADGSGNIQPVYYD